MKLSGHLRHNCPPCDHPTGEIVQRITLEKEEARWPHRSSKPRCPASRGMEGSTPSLLRHRVASARCVQTTSRWHARLRAAGRSCPRRSSRDAPSRWCLVLPICVAPGAPSRSRLRGLAHPMTTTFHRRHARARPTARTCDGSGLSAANRARAAGRSSSSKTSSRLMRPRSTIATLIR